MDPTIQAALLASVFSFGGVILGAIVTLISNWYLSRKQHEQWMREQKAEKQKWLRDKLQDIYSNCLYYIQETESYLLISHGETNPEMEIEYQKLEFEKQRFIATLNKEKQKWLNVLLIYHPERGTFAFERFLKRFQAGHLTASDIIEIATKDPRLQIDFGEEIITKIQSPR